jgi:hypothetical protein
MKISQAGHITYGALAIALLAGCAGSPSSHESGGIPSGRETALTPFSVARLAAETVAHYVARPVHPDHGSAWMAPKSKKEGKLLYVSDWSSDDVYVFNYPAGNPKGTLTGFDEPYGQCVDSKGDIWIANFAGASIVEYSHGGTTPLATLTTDGTPIGCAVSPNGDLAVANYATASGPGDIEIFTNGSGTPVEYSNPIGCYNLWPPGYDNQGNLYVEGQPKGESRTNGANAVCEIPSGGTSLGPIYFNQIINFPGSIMWDGEYLAVTDQDYGATKSTAIYQAAPSPSGNLTLEGTTDLTDTCDGYNYSDIPQPFIVGGANTPINKKEGTVAVGGNLSCTSDFGYWAYPWPSGNPIVYLPKAPAQPYGQAFSTLNKAK